MMKILYYNARGQLCLEKIPLVTFCKKKITPCYVYSRTEIENNCREIHKLAMGYNLFSCYALKANYNPLLLKLIRNLNFGADVVSAGELYFAKKCGFSVDQIVFAGVGKTPSEIELAIKSGIHSINIESEAELNIIDRTARRLKRQVRLAIRINPDIDPLTHPYISTGLLANKFGISKDLAIQLYLNLQQHPYIIADGIHVHIGSQITRAAPYLQTAKFLLQLHQTLQDEGVMINFIDLGGGIGLNYKNQLDGATIPRTYVRSILPKLLGCFKNKPVKLILELGRAVIGSAGVLVSEVLYVKETPFKKFVIIDAGMNNLIRPSLYHAYHQIIPLLKNDRPVEKVDVVGPVCETSDFLATGRKLNVPRAGEYIAITGTGAYAQASSSNYNLRPSVVEYLVEGSRIKTIFKGQTIKDIAAKYSWK
jgi:diaminopimelate decarboxylase